MRRFHDDRGDVVQIGRVDYVGHTSIKPEQSGTEYDEQAEKWLVDTDSTLEIRFDGNRKYFPDDKETRDVYEVSLKRRAGSYTFSFGQCISRSEQPTKAHFPSREYAEARKKRRQPSAYSILAGLDGYSPGTFEAFCSELGYDEDSRKKAEKTWRACVEQCLELERMYSPEELQALAEIR